MSVSSPFIQRPIATSLLAVSVLLGGFLGYRLLPVSALPQVDFPTIQITTQLPGASPDVMASLVTASLERQFGQIPALAAMTSTSSFGTSQITLQFGLDRDIDGAAQDVQSAINAAGSTLPRNLPYPPTYSKVNPADTPILTLALTSDTVSITQLSDLADTLLGQRISEVSGVGHVAVEGGLRPAIRIRADIARLASNNLSLEDVRTAIVGANVSGPKGSLDGSQKAYSIGTNDQIAVADDYKDVVISYKNNAPVRLADVATIVSDLENTKVGGWYRGKPAVIIDIQRQPGANIVQTVALIKAQLPRLQNAIPAGAELTVVSDRTGTIRASVRDVQLTLVLSVVLVVLVVFLFLRTLRATIIAGVALPLSLIATFGIMYFCGFSFDNLSLMALTIAAGFVIDDAIVMIENIVRHIEGGEEPLQAAFAGAREIGFTIVSLTMSLIAVFIPLLFMTGLVGRLFREFALTLTIAVIVSAIISLTLTPMMCGRMLKKQKVRAPGAVARRLDAGIGWMSTSYRDSLVWVLRHQVLTLLVAVLMLAATIGLYVFMPKGFLPAQDTGLITAISEADQDISFQEMQRRQAVIADAIGRDPDVASVVSLVGVGATNSTPNAGHLTITLRERDDRSSTASEIVTRLQQLTAPIAGMTIYYQPVQDIQISTRASRTQYQYTLVDADGAELSLWSARLVERLRSLPGLRDVASDQQNGGLRAMVRVDREKAGRFGVTMQSVNDTLNDAFGQRQISTIFGQANQYRVILEADPVYQNDLEALAKLYVASATGQQVPLGAFTTIERGSAPLAVTRQGQFPAATISFNLAPGTSLGEAVDLIGVAEKTIAMPETVVGTYSGDAAEFATALASQPWLILAAIVTIYIVLGVLYESFIHPITILSTLPSAGVGALLALLLCGEDLSLVALVGIVLLMGIVKKNAIMMIDFALEAERNEGLTPYDAIVRASLLRFRPIMMTTLAALFGALPLALQHGTGSELRIPLGITIIGGLLLSQLLTLYTTPVIYLGMEALRTRLGWSDGPAREVVPPAGTVS